MGNYLGFCITSQNRHCRLDKAKANVLSRQLEEDLTNNNWVAVKELELSYYIGETLLFTIYTHYGNLALNPKP